METVLRVQTEIDIREQDGVATFTVHHHADYDPAGYTLRVEQVTEDEVETYSEPDDLLAFAVRDGYSEDTYYATFQDALSAAYDCYAETVAQHFNEARGIEA